VFNTGECGRCVVEEKPFGFCHVLCQPFERVAFYSSGRTPVDKMSQ
jgi:hypothetical protein